MFNDNEAYTCCFHWISLEELFLWNISYYSFCFVFHIAKFATQPQDFFLNLKIWHFELVLATYVLMQTYVLFYIEKKEMKSEYSM